MDSLVEIDRVAPVAATGPKFCVAQNVGDNGLTYSWAQSYIATLQARADLDAPRTRSAGRVHLPIGQVNFERSSDPAFHRLKTVHAAVCEGQIVPYYQPQFNLLTGKIVGCEALARLRDKAGTVHPPGSFAEAFEDYDLGTRISACMLTHVVQDARDWLAAGVDIPHISINASAIDLRRADYANTVLGALASADLSPSRLHVEVTETVALGCGSGRIGTTLRELRAGGISIELDDFGTGFASLSHLKQLPVDVIKIDRSFIESLAECQADFSIVTALVRLAANLGMGVVAEGVETERQASTLRAIGCATAQGFHFARAMPAEEFAAFWIAQDGAHSVRKAADRASIRTCARRHPHDPGLRM